MENSKSGRHGRWLSPDPLAGDVGNPQSLNRYAYVLNNPVNFTDPTGLECYNENNERIGGTQEDCTGTWLDNGYNSITVTDTPGRVDGNVDFILHPSNYYIQGYPVTPNGGSMIQALPPETKKVPRKPGCFGVFLKATGEAWIFPSLNASAGLQAAAYGSDVGSYAAASYGSALRAAFDNYRVPVAVAEEAGGYFRIAGTLGRAAPVLSLLSLITAEVQGLRAEWAAATSGACE